MPAAGIKRCIAFLVALLPAIALAADPIDAQRDPVTNSLGMKFVWIPAGQFQMGSPAREPGRSDDEAQRDVRISRGFYLGECELTQSQFAAVMHRNPSAFSPTGNRRSAVEGMNTDDFPVDSVDWKTSVEFCQRLSELPAEKRAGRTYRLPAEAQWEYACRAGSKTSWSFGDDAAQLADYAWFGRRAAGDRPHPVGAKRPNAYGLFDMHGNVWEWCSDVNMADEHARIIRGGSWFSQIANTRCAARRDDPAGVTDPDTGFRVVLIREGEPPAEPRNE